MPEDSKGKPESSDTPNWDKVNETLSSLNEKIETSLSDFDTKFESINERLEKIPNPESVNPKSPEEDGFVPKGWEPKDYNDFFKVSKELASKEAEEKLSAYKEEVRKRVEEEEKVQSATNQEFNKQLKSLEDAGRIPKIENEHDPNDPGKVAQRELFSLGLEYKSSDLTKMADVRDMKKSRDPAGSGAPIGSSARTTDVGSKGRDYGELHNKDTDTLLAEALPDLYRK